MAEYPPRACGPCPYLAHFEPKAPPNYLESGTIPEPKVNYTKPCDLENKLGVPFTNNPPNLLVNPISGNGQPCTGNCHEGANASNTATIGATNPPVSNDVYQGTMPPCIEALRGDARLGEFMNQQGGPPCPPCHAEAMKHCCMSQETPGAPEEPCPESPYHIKQVLESYATHRNCPESKVPAASPQNQPIPNDPYAQNAPGPNDTQLKGILKTCCNQGNTQQPTQDEMAAFANAGRMDPNASPLPSSLPPVPNNLRPEPQPRPPCFLPQPEDGLDSPMQEMGPIGPWATGRVDWGPLSGLTGTRPVVDRYSIARYSEGDWRKHNKDVLDLASTSMHRNNLIDWNGRQCLEQTQSDADKNQEDNTKRLEQREREIFRWKCELERAIAAAMEEIGFIEEERARLKRAAAVLQMPESIAGECIERRTGRLDPELVRDEVEEELIKELALCAEIREQFARTLKDVDAQLLEDKTAKSRLEYDWSDKVVSHEIDSLAGALNLRSSTLLFKPGATVLPSDQSTLEFWEHFTKETLQESEATRQRSAALRGTLDAILKNAARDLRTQADKVELALAKRIQCTEEVTRFLENQLRNVLQKLADVENLINDLKAAIRRMDFSLKKAQTRLDMRLQRPRVENCRDDAQFGLIEEVKSIGEQVAAMVAQLKQAEDSQGELIKARNDLEKEIMNKRKTLEIDRLRIQKLRTYYPSATALSGYS